MQRCCRESCVGWAVLLNQMECGVVDGHCEFLGLLSKSLIREDILSWHFLRISPSFWTGLLDCLKLDNPPPSSSTNLVNWLSELILDGLWLMTWCENKLVLRVSLTAGGSSINFSTISKTWVSFYAPYQPTNHRLLQSEPVSHLLTHSIGIQRNSFAPTAPTIR